MTADDAPRLVDAQTAAWVSLVLMALAVATLAFALAVAVVRSTYHGGAGLGALNLLLAAQSGWGKSFKAQHVTGKNLPEYDHVLVLDYCDEYRGLVKEGLASWWIAGPRERAWSASTWHDFVAANQKVVLARHDRMTTDDWQAVCAAAIQGARRLGDVLIVVDEAHFVAPQVGGVPDPITGLATTGRGEARPRSGLRSGRLRPRRRLSRSVRRGCSAASRVTPICGRSTVSRSTRATCTTPRWRRCRERLTR